MRKFLISILPLTAGLLFFSNTVLAGDIGSYYLKYFDDLGFSIIRPFADLTTDYEDFIDFIEKFRDSGQLLTEEEYLAQKEEMEKASDKPDSSEPSFDEEIADSFDEITVEKSKEEPATMQPYIFSKRPNRKEWQLVLSTDKLIDFDLGDTVFICNSPFATGIFSCDRDSVLSTVLEKKQIFVSPFGFEASVGLGERNGRKILVIPETILLVPSYREKLSEYLKTYITSLKFSYPIAGEVVTDGRTTSTPLPVEPFYKTLIESWVFETSLYVLAFTFFILLSKGILVRLVNSPKVFLKMETYTSAFSRLAKKLDSLGRLFGYAFFIFSAILVSLIVTISIKDRGELNLPYLSGYFFDIFKPANIASALREGRKTHILLYILACLESLTFLLWCAPRLYDLLSLSLQKIFSPKESLKESLAHPQLNQNLSLLHLQSSRLIRLNR